MIEYPNVPGPELRRIMAGLKTDYRFYLCTMTFPDYCEHVVTRMIEFGKPFGEMNFNYLRETYPDHSIHYFWFNRWADVMAFQQKFAATWGWTPITSPLNRVIGRWVRREMRQSVHVRTRAFIV